MLRFAASRLVPIPLALIALAGSPARADGVPDPAPTPTQSPSSPAFEYADVTKENDPRVRAYTVQGAYTGATYGPGDAHSSQIIARVASFRIGHSFLRLFLPRVQTINGLAGGITDMQALYLFTRPVRAGIAFLGVTAQLPTASNPRFGTGKWLVGPAAVYFFAYKRRRAVAGFLLQTATSVAGPSRQPNQTVMTFLPLGVANLGRGWFVKWPESPWIFDLQRGRSLITLGLGIGRQARIGPEPILISISDEITVVHANTPNAPKNTVRLTFTVIPPSSSPP
jgi:hypothetical protein